MCIRDSATHVEIPGHPEPTLAVTGSRPTWMWGMEHGVNEAGVAVGNEMIFTLDDPRAVPPALTGMDLVRLALERSRNAAGAVAVVTGLIERHGQGGSGHDHEDVPYWSSFLVADAATAWVVETSGRTWEAEEVVCTRASRWTSSKAGMVVRFEMARVQPTSSASQVRPEVSTTHAVDGSATRNDDQYGTSSWSCPDPPCPWRSIRPVTTATAPA